VPFGRGDVYKHLIDVTARGGVGDGAEEKYIVILQEAAAMDDGASNIAFVVCSTDNTNGRRLHGHEVRLNSDSVSEFTESTTVDGRWVYTHERSEFENSVWVDRLDIDTMDCIAVAVYIGLQLTPPDEEGDCAQR
jgi:hypothetical protein